LVDDRVRDAVVACATTAEVRTARKAGLNPRLVGVGACRGVPEGGLVSFGLAGSLDGLGVGTVVDATRVVDGDGRTLWEGPGLGVPGAVPATVVAASRIVDGEEARRRLRERSGGDVVDLESGVLAATGRLRGVLRAVSDTPERPLGPLVGALRPDGRPDLRGFARALLRHPVATMRALSGIRRGLRALERPL
jgi:hypothetical protein